MKTSKAAVLLGLAAAGALLLSACGGSDGDSGDSTSNIRTDNGLAVAAIGAGFDPRLKAESDQDGAEQTSDRIGAPGFPDADTVATDDRLSPYYAPSFQEGGSGITVQGYGTASADADSAIIELYFFANGGGGVEPQPAPAPDTSSRSSDGSTGIAVGEPASPGGDFGDRLQTVDPITEAQLQPVIDALVGAGVPREDIEFIGQGYYDKYSSSATLRATVSNLAVLDAAVNAATAAAANLGPIQLSSTNVVYTIADCAALESAATKAAVDDAKDRGIAFAQALGVDIGAITGASNYSYSPYGGSACGSAYGGPYPLAVDSASASGSRTVQVFANVSVTYAIQ
jgi:uncharacterized protein YggE